MQARWTDIPKPPEGSKDLARALHISEITAGLLMDRGLDTPEAANAFLNPSLAQLAAWPPSSILGMEKATARMVSAIQHGEPILICGDYDADGITATAVLASFLMQAGARVHWHLPHRVDHGYGFHVSQITEQAIPLGARLIVTVDCGCTAFEAVEEAGKHGIDVIITDHHTTGDELPKAFAIINPKQPGCSSGLESLAGVGLSFYLAASVRTALEQSGHPGAPPKAAIKSLCDLVALGTIADIVPLTKANRVLTQTGLDVINGAPRPGISALLSAAKANKEQVDAEDVAFRLAPRLNAAGRMTSPDEGLHLMLANTLTAASPMAKSLCTLNSHRQDEEKRIFEEIATYIEETPALLTRNALVLAKKGWHPGVLGIVASRVVREYGKPTFVISVNEKGIGKGSGRSVPGVNLYEALAAASQELEKFGGHHQAAGLQLKDDRIPFFHKLLEAHLAETTNEEDYDIRITPDAELPLSEISPELINELEQLAPFGEGNREPLFMAEDIRVLSSSVVGKSHRRYLLEVKGSTRFSKVMAIRFNHAPEDAETRIEKLLYSLRWNRWNGSKSPQLLIHDMVARPAGPTV